MTGRSVPAAHLFSIACATAAALIAWRWLRVMYAPRVAAPLGLAVALNWTWDRTGGAIQSEPLYLLLSQAATLAAVRVGRRGGIAEGAGLGVLLAACILTRHVGAALAVAVGFDLLLRNRTRVALALALTGALLLLPWGAWLASVRAHTQAGLLFTGGGLANRLVSQTWFYVQRLPDVLTGPFVEVATVFGRARPVAVAATAWALLATGLLVFGGVRTMRTPRRRLAGLIAGGTLALLLIWPFTEAGRFLIPLVPYLLVGTTEGVAAVLALVRPRSARAWAAWLVLAAAVPYSAYALITDRAAAARRTHADFDAACAWIAHQANAPGPILTRHPGEVYWQTGRTALAPGSDDPEAIIRAIDRYGVAYLLVDDDRYTQAPDNPLTRFARRHSGRVREVWRRATGRASITIYRIVPGTPTALPARAFKLEPAVIFVTMETRLGQGGRAHQDGL